MKPFSSYVLAVALLASASAVEGKMKLSSNAFSPGQPIPAKFSGEGLDVSPELKWEGMPAETKSFVLICDDPDAPGGTWVHWVIYAIPGGTTDLPENVTKTDTVAGMKQGVNSWGKVGYGGPMPPPGHGRHRYYFKLYALDTELPLKPRATKAALETAMTGHIVGRAELMGTYERK